MKTDPEDNALSYEVFDRQLNNFYRMLHVLMEGWDDYSPQELTFDIRSLCTKANRLCHMAVQDLALQHSDIANQRKQANEEHCSKLDILVGNHLTPLMARIVKESRAGHYIEGNRTKWAPIEMTELIPLLNDYLENDDLTDGKILDVKDIEEIEKLVTKKLKPTKIPGVKPAERLWNFFQLYSMACYLWLHFRRVSHFTTLAKSEEQMARLMEMSVQQYQQEYPEELERYFATLLYINNVKMLSADELLDARKELIKEVPQNLQLAFARYVSDIRQLGAQLIHIDFTAQELKQLLSATVKWHLIEEELYTLYHPERIVPTLNNQVFFSVQNGTPIDMEQLRERMKKMVDMVTRKNHWFCVWCVLKHHNLLRDTQNFNAFAHQMMSREWFGDIDERYTFSGDTLREYRRYFSDIDFKEWDNDDFMAERAAFGMKKWSPNLCQQFTNLCYQMDEVFCD